MQARRVLAYATKTGIYEQSAQQKLRRFVLYFFGMVSPPRLKIKCMIGTVPYKRINETTVFPFQEFNASENKRMTVIFSVLMTNGVKPNFLMPSITDQTVVAIVFFYLQLQQTLKSLNSSFPL